MSDGNAVGYICSTDSDHHPFLSQLNLPRFSSIALAQQAGCQYVLLAGETGLRLQAVNDGKIGSLLVDFYSSELNRRTQQSSQQELIRKAIGIASSKKPKVWDITAGLGSDAWVMANLGYNVEAFERHPIVFALLNDGFTRAKLEFENQGREKLNTEKNDFPELEIGFIDGRQALADNIRPNPDVIYIDPMYPEKQKNAKSKKAMQYFQSLVGKDDDAEELLDLALARANYRVIVKRPPKAVTLGDRKPSMAISGKSVRYDIYTLKSVNYFDEKNPITR